VPNVKAVAAKNNFLIVSPFLVLTCFLVRACRIPVQKKRNTEITSLPQRLEGAAATADAGPSHLAAAFTSPRLRGEVGARLRAG
ncbi:MAG TPA: hypothetical protein VNO18_25395, partial [Xanthobacteraceae bacterium]|nr:hypothetical protein [Xanthobacteraceae bacterium]